MNTSKVDPQLLSIVSNYIKPGFVVWDIGANIGLFTLTAAVKAGRTGKVLSVEADVFNSYILSKSLKANPDLNIDLLTCAIANQKGLVQFNIANRARCSNFINLSKGNTDSGGVRNYYNVLSLTLDEIIKWYDAPDFIKVDIEGAEKYLLAGAEELFQMYTPIVYMEVEKINADLKTAMLARDEISLRGVRAIKAAILLALTESGASKELSQPAELSIITINKKDIKISKELFFIYTLI